MVRGEGMMNTVASGVSIKVGIIAWIVHKSHLLCNTLFIYMFQREALGRCIVCQCRLFMKQSMSSEKID